MTLRKPISICLVCLCLLGCEDKQPEAVAHPKPAKVITIASPVTQRERRFPGKVEASDRVNLSFEVGGKIDNFPVNEGDELKKGALVAKLDPSEYRYAVQQAKAKYELTKSEEYRYGELRKEGHVSASDYDKKKSEYDVAVANLKKANKDLADATLKAPFDGMVIRKYVKLFQQVKPQEQIVSFQDITQIDIRVNFPENVVATLKKGEERSLKVSFEALPNRTFPVTIKEFSAEADPETQTYDGVLTMPAPKGVNILPGMTATLVMQLPVRNHTQDSVYLVPSAAVFKSEQGDPSVWVVNPNSKKVIERAVETGKLIGNNIEIHQGVKVGDTIVIAGVNFLHAGDTIKPIQDKQ